MTPLKTSLKDFPNIKLSSANAMYHGARDAREWKKAFEREIRTRLDFATVLNDSSTMEILQEILGDV